MSRASVSDAPYTWASLTLPGRANRVNAPRFFRRLSSGALTRPARPLALLFLCFLLHRSPQVPLEPIQRADFGDASLFASSEADEEPLVF